MTESKTESQSAALQSLMDATNKNHDERHQNVIERIKALEVQSINKDDLNHYVSYKGLIAICLPILGITCALYAYITPLMIGDKISTVSTETKEILQILRTFRER
jgi:hypothetical protein